MKKITVENAVCRWLDMKLKIYDKLETYDSVFLYDQGNDQADIVISKKDKNLYFNWDVLMEFSEIFPMELAEYKEVISKWIGDTFNLRGVTVQVTGGGKSSKLEIPLD